MQGCDAGKNTLTVGLPVPLSMLPYTEIITTDEPAGTHDTPTPKGPAAEAASLPGQRRGRHHARQAFHGAAPGRLAQPGR